MTPIYLLPIQAVLIGGLFTGLLAYGIGEICTLLTRMDYRIKTMNKDK